MSRAKRDWVRRIPVEVVPADVLGKNPRNPYDNLTEGERRERFVKVLAGIYLQWKEKSGSPK